MEAARAGEHGKGFAVVAEEVGNLAQMSGNAAKEISEMLEKSISEVSRVANTTKEKVEVIVAQGKAKLDLGTQNAHACGDVLNEIVSQVGELNRMVGEISTASQEQSVGVKEITKAINQLDQVTQTTANESQSSAQNSEQLLKQADQMREVVGTLVLLIDGGRKAA